jgi:GT2 family glycosyltransferase
MKNCLIIINCNDYKSTKHLVDNVIDYKIIDKILIVDNNSREEERNLIKSIKNKKIEKIFNDENIGYSSAINLGSKYLVDKYGKCNFIISNSDIVIMDEKDLSTLIDLLSFEKVGLVVPSLMERGQINRGWKDIGAKTDFLLGIPIIRDFVPDSIIYYNKDVYQSEYSFVDNVSSAFFLITSENLQKIGYMDEKVFLYYEGSILSKKIRDNDLMVVISNKVRIKHLYSRSVDNMISGYKKYKLFKDSQLYYYSTYREISKFAMTLLRIQRKIGLFNRKLFRKK